VRAGFDVDDDAVAAAAAILERRRIGIHIVGFEPERRIDGVLARIPAEIAGRFAEITVIDDSSDDLTFDVALAAGERLGLENLRVLRTPSNRGYGGNQKLVYLRAIKLGLDAVILLHGDGQYAPELLPQIIVQLGRENVDAVIGSRMIKRLDALRARMPVYKWVGNQVLTAIENAMLGTHLAEFHSGYRAYKVEALRAIPFDLDSDGFHFDIEILIQLIRSGRTIVEVPVPTFSGDEISPMNGMRYAVNCVKAVTKARLVDTGLFFDPKFDTGQFEERSYVVKTAPNSLHQHVLSLPRPSSWRIANLGVGRGALSSALDGGAEAVELDLDGPFDETLGRRRYDAALALDTIEHLTDPESAARRIAAILKPGGVLYASTGNVANVVVRFSLLAGQFNYGKRGVLALTHRRLFTIRSFTKLLRNSGFDITEVRGFGPPLRDTAGGSKALRATDAVLGKLARRWPRLFAFNFLVTAEKAPELEDLYERTSASTGEIYEEPDPPTRRRAWPLRRPIGGSRPHD
jgi:SAM-dependent methyltransferase